MNILLVISLVILILSLFGMYRIYQNASSNTLVDENYVIDIDQSIIDFLRNGGRNIKKTFGFVILSIASLYKIIIQLLKNNKLTQKVFDKIQF